MRTSLVLLILLLCGLLIAGCTSTTTKATTSVAGASGTPTTQATTTYTSAQTTTPVAVTTHSSVTTSSGSGTVTITALDLKGETVKVSNSGSSPVNLAGWKLTDEGAKHSYSFTGTTLPAAGSVTISSGTASGDLKWTSTNVWNNDGDTAYLYDGSGQLVCQKSG